MGDFNVANLNILRDHAKLLRMRDVCVGERKTADEERKCQKERQTATKS